MCWSFYATATGRSSSPRIRNGGFKANHVKTICIEPESAWQKGFVESFTGDSGASV